MHTIINFFRKLRRSKAVYYQPLSFADGRMKTRRPLCSKQ